MKSALVALALTPLALASAPPPHAGGPGGKPGTPGKGPKEYVSSKKLQDLIKTKNLYEGAKALQKIADKHGGNRAFGSGGHNGTVDYIYNTLKKTGYYDVVKQPFTEIFSEGTGALSVDGADIAASIMTYTPSGEYSGPVVHVEGLGCTAAEFPAEVSGKVALLSRGTCSFGEKAVAAKAAGAAGLIIYNNIPGSMAGTLGAPFLDYAPVVSISQEDSVPIKERLAAGETVNIEFVVDATTEERVNYNVLAETKMGDHNNVLVVGGHSDSVSAGPGINDDGSGTIGNLEVAVQLANFKVKNAVRFGFWGAEEFGLLGSYYYVNSLNGSDSELSKIRAYLNFDMIASPNSILGVYDGDGSAFGMVGPDGSDVLEKDFEEFFKSKKSPSVPTEFSGRSDYAAFIENGIPSGGLFTGAEVLKTEEEAKLFGGEAGVSYDPNYHKVGDDINNLDMGAFLINTKAIANSIAKYALSFKSLPAVNLNQRRWSGDRQQMLKRAGTHVHVHDGGVCGGGDRYSA